MISKKIIVIDGSSIRQNRGVSAYVNSLISGLSKVKIPSNIQFVVMIPLGCKLNVKTKDNLSIVKKPFINKILWDLVLLPLYCWWAGGYLLHYTENTGGSLLPRLLRLKIVLTIHDVSFLKPFNLVSKPSSLKQWIGLYYRRLFVSNIAKNSKIIFTVSKFAKKDIIKELLINSKKIIVVYNSLPHKFVSPRTCSQEKKIIIVTGNSNQKNLKFTLESLQQFKSILKGWKILVIGVDGKNSKYINYIGKVDQNNLIRFYDRSSILIMPSLYESFSIPLIEALSREVFVISSNKGAPPEIIKNFGFLYNPKSMKDLKSSVVKALYKDRYKKKLMKKKAKLYALSFTDKNLTERTMKEYKKLLK